VFGSVGVSIVGLGTGLLFDDTFTANGLNLTFVQAPIPEPSTFALLGAGLALLIGTRRLGRSR
jgi:hypothetical protein